MHTRHLIIAAALLPCLVIIHCALTADTVSEGPQGDYFDPASPDTNKTYFANVRQYFYGIGITISDNEVRAYTAVRYISSQPPDAAVYVGPQFLGITNHGPMYFKPGQYRVTFSKYGRDWSDILSFVQGRNASLTVRIPWESR